LPRLNTGILIGFGRKEKDGETHDFFERPRGVSLSEQYPTTNGGKRMRGVMRFEKLHNILGNNYA